MTKETKVRLLQIILNAGIGGTDREMLDNLKAVIKAIKNEGEKMLTLPSSSTPGMDAKIGGIKNCLLPKKKAGRPPKKR